jgi:hypothetical protein
MTIMTIMAETGPALLVILPAADGATALLAVVEGSNPSSFLKGGGRNAPSFL